MKWKKLGKELNFNFQTHFCTTNYYIFQEILKSAKLGGQEFVIWRYFDQQEKPNPGIWPTIFMT